MTLETATYNNQRTRRISLSAYIYETIFSGEKEAENGFIDKAKQKLDLPAIFLLAGISQIIKRKTTEGEGEKAIGISIKDHLAAN